ncbi:uncharacterized protein LACBIDRAFT_302108 [Laccaria bicolor S238N-H82]|uniref:Predicted protein n=1 Tax=Laccaria bicolor (strain S238N-H82 / ATCC MYA-4686) TaxID=486041 RepID=B0DH36_LACBS|nr:uncharacterized protein LACBIDRAFT_302108 [Laccaria bicolor S238N-H82]EDR05944.1 predicted protein [Laccaria bicolor S238N-H82]|eukprot:XP_001883232.1 predicted protein [Laccaria bicolor S238N-H82]
MSIIIAEHEQALVKPATTYFLLSQPFTGSTYSPPLPEAFHAKGRKRTILASTMPRVGNVGYSGR